LASNGRRNKVAARAVSESVGRRRRVEAWGIAAVLALAWSAPLASASELRDRLRLGLFERINEIRVGHGLSPLAKDPLAFRVSQQHSARQVFDGSYGHFATDGLAPYHRYSFAGGDDGVLENVASWSSDAPYDESELAGLVERSLQAMMDETPPDDGHRRVILDPWATHLGTGLAWRGGEVRITQTFVRRYVNWVSSPPRRAAAAERVVLEGVPAEGWNVGAVSVHYEPFPQSMRPAKANSIEDWNLPADRLDYEAKRLDDASPIVRLSREGGSQPGELFVRGDRSFTFVVPFTRGPGVYTVVAWVRRNGNGSHPIPASNVSIRFENDPSGDGRNQESAR
jgi:uncharacterized protein YkwD